MGPLQDLSPRGKTKVWNQSGVFPSACVALQNAAESACPTAIVWRGNSGLPTYQQGFTVLGKPLGHPDIVQRFLEGKIAEHRVQLERIREVPDTQSAWLLLSFCAAAQANFFLRAVNPDNAKWFAAAHDQGVWQCFCRITQILATVGGRDRTSECMENAAGSPLGKLGRRTQNGEGTPPGCGVV